MRGFISAPTGASELQVVANGIPSNLFVVNVQPFRFWNFPNYEAIAKLIGSLADGPLWVLGPNGPIPVDPWGPKFTNRAEKAYNEIRSGLRALNEIGTEIIQLREQAQPKEILPTIKSNADVRSRAA